MYIGSLQKKSACKKILKLAAFFSYVSFGCITYSTIYLFQQILSTSRYDIAYIYNYSSPFDPLIYRISSFWAGQEGSLLLWVFFCAIIGYILQNKFYKSSPIVLGFWHSILTALLLMSIITDPFCYLSNYRPGMLGEGLNPLLKNLWMAVHPPCVFLAYSALAVPAAISIQSVVNCDISKLSRNIYSWTLFGWTLLTAGLLLGMLWSYEVLGWGGYWSWDPVENASFVPWLTSTALIHCLHIQKRSNRIAIIEIILAISTFILIIYAAFLTRSGVLSNISVHSFVKSPLYPYLKAILIAYCVFCFGITFAYRNRIQAFNSALFSRKDYMLLICIILLLLFAGFVCTGTTFTTFCNSGVIESKFYNHLSIPILIGLIITLAISMLINIKKIKMPLYINLGANTAHFGVILFMSGVGLSQFGKSTTIAINKGSYDTSFGYKLEYIGNMRLQNAEAIRLKLMKDNFTNYADLKTEFADGKSYWMPYILSELSGDLYISPLEIKNLTVTPIAELKQNRWEAYPVKLPNINSTLTLIGMQVESKTVKLRYKKAGDYKPVYFTISESHSRKIDGQEFIFAGFAKNSNTMSNLSAGVNIEVLGEKNPQTIILKLQRKPFIWILWLGGILILAGGVIGVCIKQYG